MSNLSRDSDRDGDLQGWQSPKSKKKKKKVKKVVVATRTSQRILRDGVPVVEKAALRASAKNYILGNNSSANSFTILQNTPSDVLQNLVSDMNIVVENIEEQIGVFRAEELARAALAEANYKVYLDKLKDRDKPRVEDTTEDLSIGVINNSERLVFADASVNNLTKGVENIIENNSQDILIKGVKKPKEVVCDGKHSRGGMLGPQNPSRCDQ
jgi:hypothetical protein